MAIHYDKEYLSQNADYSKEIPLMDQLRFLTNYAKRKDLIIYLKKIPIIKNIHITPEDTFQDVKERYEKKLATPRRKYKKKTFHESLEGPIQK